MPEGDVVHVPSTHTEALAHAGSHTGAGLPPDDVPVLPDMEEPVLPADDADDDESPPLPPLPPDALRSGALHPTENTNANAEGMERYRLMTRSILVSANDDNTREHLTGVLAFVNCGDHALHRNGSRAAVHRGFLRAVAIHSAASSLSFNRGAQIGGCFHAADCFAVKRKTRAEHRHKAQCE